MSLNPDIEELTFERNALNTQMTKLIEERNKTNEQVQSIADNISKIDRQISNIRKSHKSNKTGITDHALLRYLERIHGFDTEEVRKKLMTDSLRKCMETYKTGKVTENSITYIFRDNVVVTIMAD
jgi:uncharacterized coiled-coil DUF342 family protein